MKILAKWKHLQVKLDSPEEQKAFDHVFSRLNAAKDPALLISLELVNSGQFVPNLEHIIGKQLIVTGLLGSGKISKRQIPSMEEDKPKKKKAKPLPRRKSMHLSEGLLGSGQLFSKR